MFIYDLERKKIVPCNIFGHRYDKTIVFKESKIAKTAWTRLNT